MASTALVMDKLRDLCVAIDAAQLDHSQRLSVADKAVTDIYHTIEESEFNASQGYALAKRLQEALRERRRIKGDQGKLHIMHQLKNHLKGYVGRLERK
jgi:hypothetical protein